MASLTMADAASRPMKKNWVVHPDEGTVGEKVADAMTGRGAADRRLYNATRGDTVGETIMGKQASEKLLKSRMKDSERDAERVDEAVPRRKSPLYKKDEED